MLELMEKAAHRKDDEMGGVRLRSGSWRAESRGGSSPPGKQVGL